MLSAGQMKNLTTRGARIVAHGNDTIALKTYLEQMAADFARACVN